MVDDDDTERVRQALRTLWSQSVAPSSAVVDDLPAPQPRDPNEPPSPTAPLTRIRRAGTLEQAVEREAEAVKRARDTIARLDTRLASAPAIDTDTAHNRALYANAREAAQRERAYWSSALEHMRQSSEAFDSNIHRGARDLRHQRSDWIVARAKEAAAYCDWYCENPSLTDCPPAATAAADAAAAANPLDIQFASGVRVSAVPAQGVARELNHPRQMHCRRCGWSRANPWGRFAVPSAVRHDVPPADPEPDCDQLREYHENRRKQHQMSHSTPSVAASTTGGSNAKANANANASATVSRSTYLESLIAAAAPTLIPALCAVVTDYALLRQSVSAGGYAEVCTRAPCHALNFAIERAEFVRFFGGHRHRSDARHVQRPAHNFVETWTTRGKWCFAWINAVHSGPRASLPADVPRTTAQYREIPPPITGFGAEKQHLNLFKLKEAPKQLLTESLLRLDAREDAAAASAKPRKADPPPREPAPMGPPPYVHIAALQRYDDTAVDSASCDFDVYHSSVPWAADNPAYRFTFPCDQWVSLWDVEVAPYRSGSYRVPDTCFADGHVAMAHGSTRHVFSVGVGDRVRCPLLTDAAGDAFCVRRVVKVLSSGQPDVFRCVQLHSSAKSGGAKSGVDSADSADGRRVVLTRGHPVFVDGEWRRPDELATPLPRVTTVCNFVLSDDFELRKPPSASAGSSVALTEGCAAEACAAARTIVVGGVLCATIGSDCGARLAALYPDYHSRFGPDALRR